MRLKAQSQVQLLGQVALSLSLDTNLLFTWHGQGTRGELDNKTLYEIFVGRNSGIQSAPGTDWGTSGRFTDPWGRDYHFVFERSTEEGVKLSGQLKVRSLGPNGTDEKGLGDDITSEAIRIDP